MRQNIPRTFNQGQPNKRMLKYAVQKRTVANSLPSSLRVA
jgi:hypothetical protein